MVTPARSPMACCGLLLALAAFASGCHSAPVFFADGDRHHFQSVATTIDDPDPSAQPRPELRSRRRTACGGASRPRVGR